MKTSFSSIKKRSTQILKSLLLPFQLLFCWSFTLMEMQRHEFQIKYVNIPLKDKDKKADLTWNKIYNLMAYKPIMRCCE